MKGGWGVQRGGDGKDEMGAGYSTAIVLNTIVTLSPIAVGRELVQVL